MLNFEKLLKREELFKLKNALKQEEPIKLKLNKDLVNKIYNLEKLNTHINTTTLVYPYVSVNNYRSSTCKYDLIKRTKNKHFNALETKISKKNLLYRIAKGDTLVINYIQEYDKDVEEMVFYFENLLNINSNANLYYAFKNTKGINLHFDLHDVLAIQFHGKKYWKLLKEKGDTSKPLEKTIKPNLNTYSKDKIMNFETVTGEALYIPKGMWHYAYTQDESSLHLAVTLAPLKVSDIFIYLLNDELKIGEKNIYNLDNLEILYEALDKLKEKFVKLDKKKMDLILESLKEREDIIIKLQ